MRGERTYPGRIVTLSGRRVVGPVDLVEYLAPDVFLVDDVPYIIQIILDSFAVGGAVQLAGFVEGLASWFASFEFRAGTCCFASH